MYWNDLRSLMPPRITSRTPSWSYYDRYGDSGVPGFETISPRMWSAMGAAAHQAGRYGQTPEQPAGPTNPFNQDWLKSMTEDYHNPLLDMMSYRPGPAPLSPFDYGQGPARLSRQSGRHGNGGGNVRNPTNRRRSQNAANNSFIMPPMFGPQNPTGPVRRQVQDAVMRDFIRPPMFGPMNPAGPVGRGGSGWSRPAGTEPYLNPAMLQRMFNVRLGRMR